MFENQPVADHDSGRQFICLLAGLAMALGTVLAAWPLIDSMNPSAEALRPVVSIDLNRIPPGGWKIVHWRELPVLVAQRTPEQIAAAQDGDHADLLFPETDRERVQRAEWLVVVAHCYFGFLPKEKEPPHDVRRLGRWSCPHGDHYDDSGRLRGDWGVGNFPIPPYYFQGSRWLVIGDETGELGLYPFSATPFTYRIQDEETRSWRVVE